MQLVNFSPSAYRAFKSLSTTLEERVKQTLRYVLRDPNRALRNKTIAKLEQLGVQRENLYSLRLDEDLRVIFTVDKRRNAVLVTHIVARGGIS
jgi:mRNA-degrading endonuclease RelE of RelBE toxin-antitoxin system